MSSDAEMETSKEACNSMHAVSDPGVEEDFDRETIREMEERIEPLRQDEI